MLEIGLILIVIFVLRNLQLIIISVLIIAGLSYFGLLDVDNLKGLITSQLGSSGVPITLLNDIINNSNQTNITIVGG
jgi:hypothetical protein